MRTTLTRTIESKFGARKPPPPRHGVFTNVPAVSRGSPACDGASLGSNPRQPTNQSKPPTTKLCATWAPVFGTPSQGSQPDYKLLASTYSPVRHLGVWNRAQQVSAFSTLTYLGTGFLLDSWTLRMGPIGCPETSVSNYHHSLINNPEERSYMVQSSAQECTSYTAIRRLTTGIRSEKCVVRRFRRCANVRECTHTNLDNITYYTPRLYGIAYCS